jgi:CubicO group peptidase (beta-lactamase class C family)
MAIDRLSRRVVRHALQGLLHRDSESFARGLPGKLVVRIVLVAIPVIALVWSLRRGSFIDDSWVAPLWLLALATGYLISRRLIVTILGAALIVGLVTGAAVPRVSAERHGDAAVHVALEEAHEAGMLVNYRDLAVAVIDPSSAQPVRIAGLGATADTRMEVGSLTKAMTGLVVADAVARGEVQLDEAIAHYLPELNGSPAGAVTLRELVTHTSGLDEFGGATLFRGFWSSPLGRNFFATDAAELAAEARASELGTRGSYAYSTLGAAIAGQVVAAATGMTYADLMRVRLFEPLGMTDTAIEDDRNAVAGGWSKSGLPVEPWVMGAYAPGGGAISTIRDLTVLATALLDGTAPGMAALDPTTETGTAGIRIGQFWHVTAAPDAPTLTWHTGQTGGYTTYFALDRAQGTAVIVLSDVSNTAVTTLGDDLLADLT